MLTVPQGHPRQFSGDLDVLEELVVGHGISSYTAP